MHTVFTWLSYKTAASYNDNGNTRKFILDVDTYLFDNAGCIYLTVV